MTDQNSAPPYPTPQPPPNTLPVQPPSTIQQNVEPEVLAAQATAHLQPPPPSQVYPVNPGTQDGQGLVDLNSPLDQPTSVGSRKEFDPEQPLVNPAGVDQGMISIDKEKPPVPSKPTEMVSYTEVGAEQEIDPELAEYMSRVEKDKLELNEPVVVHGQTVVEPANWHGQPSITLPTDKQTIITGLKASVSKNVRWLATWCMRMISKFQGRVIYSDAPHNPENKSN